MRDDEWLIQRMNQIWQLLFPEVDKLNNVIVRFKGKWKNKFGHIKRLKNKDTEIAINSLFKDSRVPEYIIDLTLAHELVHYWHGFNSPHQQKYKHPHLGGIVTRELNNRGFGHILRKEKAFIKKQWWEIYRCYEKPKKKPSRRFFFL
jgi:hypothetical protein